MIFLKEETLKENNLLVEYHNKTKQPKTSLFSMFTQSLLYKNKCYVPIRTLDNYICALKKNWSLKAIRIFLKILDYQNVQTELNINCSQREMRMKIANHSHGIKTLLTR